MKKYENNEIRKYFIGIGIGLISTIIIICVFAFVLLLLKLDRGYCEVFATISVSIGSFVTSYYISYKSRKKGYIIGSIVGFCYFLIITVISLIIAKGNISSNTLFHFLIIMLSSIVGGIVAVNKKDIKII